MWRPRAPRRRSSFAQIRFLVQSLVIAAGIHSRFNKRLEFWRDLVSGAPGHAISVEIVRGEIDHRTVRLRGILLMVRSNVPFSESSSRLKRCVAPSVVPLEKTMG